MLWSLDNKRSKVGKAKALVMQEKGIETYTSAELDTLIGIEQSLYKNDFVASVLNNSSGKAEQSYWWTHSGTGLPCKARCDYVVDDMVIELKTCGEGLASPDRFMKTVVVL